MKPPAGSCLHSWTSAAVALRSYQGSFRLGYHKLMAIELKEATKLLMKALKVYSLEWRHPL